MKKALNTFAALAFCSPTALAVYDIFRLFSGLRHSSDTVRAFSLAFILITSAFELGISIIMILLFVQFRYFGIHGDRRNCLLVVAAGSLFDILLFGTINYFSKYSVYVVFFFFLDLFLLSFTALLTRLAVENKKRSTDNDSPE